VEVSLFVVRVFVEIRRVLSEHQALAQRLDELERKLADHDTQILAVVQTIRALFGPAPVPKQRRIGCKTNGEPCHRLAPDAGPGASPAGAGERRPGPTEDGTGHR
jgi:hypothetical protein